MKTLLALLLIFPLWSFGQTKAPPKKEKTLVCDDSKTQRVSVSLGRLTILNFPVTPKEILPGENSFDFRQIKNDLAIKSLRPGARTNVFVYMAERRCAFDLVTVGSGGDDIIFIRDPKDRQMEVSYK
ncbi:hypothetical protein [Bdellovibrio sp.]|uniref:hypothetical protein n=1 Tax=Bdellovibrio sp. TaxID=28201 RepID=UPI001A382C94|nr:MAG: hypothetical protein BroJett040_25030 [Oligoflexia bacterium]